MAEINVRNLTKDYGNGKGIFDINLEIEKGEIFGYAGTNDSGKTTTIRHIMGFLNPDKGNAFVHGKDSWKDAYAIKKLVGYVPGEIAFPDIDTGSRFLKIQAELLGVKNMGYTNELIKKLQLDTSANLKRMSKGMKQKTAIVAAFMSDPEILILDERT
jgi:ABC-2 type transport system ATP-binding protein